ncbi:MAG: ribose-phosphate diphosphokinase [Polyangiales bacterium]
MPKRILYSTARYDALADQIAKDAGCQRGALQRQSFPDGERYQRIADECSGQDVIVLGGTVTDDDTLEIFDLACGLVQWGVHTLTIVIPWFGYQTMERPSRFGEIAVAKTRAKLFSAIPAAGSGNRILLVDLHTEGITQYFEQNIRPVHISARPLIVDMLRDASNGKEFVVGATDAGRAQWVEQLANDLGVDAAFVFKRRLSGNKTEVTSMSADVHGRNVFIYDDMIRTGGSLIAAAEAFKSAGANEIIASCTHGVFAENALDRLRKSGLFSRVLCTDTRPHVNAIADDFLRVYSVAPLIARHLQS